MSIRSVLAYAFAATAAVALSACEQTNRTPVPEAPAAGATVPVDEPATTAPDDEIDATQVVDRAPVADAPPGFDVKALAGTFAADGANLQLAADGTYTLTVHAESADADLTSTGTWTVEADGAELLLDPDSKDDADRRYAIASDDELVAVEGGQVLRRDGA